MRTVTKKHPLVRYLAIWLVLLNSMLIMAFVLCFMYFISLVKQNEIRATENEMTIYIGDMKSCLKSASQSLDEIAYSTLDIIHLDSKNQTQRYFAEISCARLLTNKINYTNVADGYFVKETGCEVVLSAYNDRVNSMQRSDANTFLKKYDFLTFPDSDSNWSVIWIGKTAYYLKYRNINTIYVGVMIKADTLMSFMRKESNEKASFILTDNQGKSLSSFGNLANKILLESDTIPNSIRVVKKYGCTLVSLKIGEASTRLTNIILQKDIYSEFSNVQRLLTLLVLLCVGMGLWILIFAIRHIVSPVKQLIEATKVVEQGNWEHTVEVESNANELELLGNSFNHMVFEIKNLKIEAYEEKILRQKTELHYLQMQLHPHFYLNALSTVHSLVSRDKNTEAQKFMELLSEYLRYSIRNELSKVTIEEEIQRVDAYLEMQSIRFPNSVFLSKDVAPDLLHNLVPQFIILTFVENALKHAMTLESILCIFLQVSCVRKEHKDYLCLIIEDNGRGFPPEVLDGMENKISHSNYNGDHIGIFNIKKTLYLLYGEDCSISFSNSHPTGAHIEILLKLSEEEVHEDSAN